MPSWSPNWEDVRFDHAAATDAAGELRAAAGRVRDVIATRERGRRTDLEGWVGPARRDWELRFGASQRAGEDLAEQLTREAVRIESAADWARDEQRRRERAREAWRRERAAEQEAARRAADEQARRQRLAQLLR